MRRVSTVRVADHDPDLFELVDPSQSSEAAAAALAETEWLEPGPWRPKVDGYRPHGHFGLLLLDGLLIRRVKLGERHCVELLGPGDLLRPWVTFGSASTISVEARWEVQERTQVAILDPRFAARVTRWPEIAGALMDRMARRSRWLAVHLAICHMPKLQVRLRVLFWYLADRWGKVTPQGIVVALPLTHETLAGLVGARRPAVTTALGELAGRGEVERRRGGVYVLHGDPPPELEETHVGASGAHDGSAGERPPDPIAEG